MSKILIHACCAHCLGKLLAGLAAEPAAWDPAVFWGNPNVHPLIEILDAPETAAKVAAGMQCRGWNE